MRYNPRALMPESLQPLERIAVALLVGFLIGLDRERAEVRKEHSLFAGVRTFPLIALAGAVPMLLVAEVGPGLVLTSFAIVGAIALVSYARQSAGGRIGATTEVAAVATFLLGALAGAGALTVAGAAGVIVSVLLVAKPRLEAFSRALTPDEISAALELAVITVIVLPLLPNRPYGPWGVLNPREIWIVVVLVSGLSFVAFVAVRSLGEQRGMAVTGAAGGLVSSTAVTMAMAQRSRAGGPAVPTATAAVLASALMPLRVSVLAGAVNAGILPRLLPSMAAMGTVGVLLAWWTSRGMRGVTDSSPATLTNPFSLRAALTFGGVYAAVLLMVHGAEHYLGRSGIYATAALSGVADVDAPTLAFARLGPGTTTWEAPAAAVVIAAVSNTLVKIGIAVSIGTGAFRVRVAGALAAMALAGVTAAVVVVRVF